MRHSGSRAGSYISPFAWQANFDSASIVVSSFTPVHADAKPWRNAFGARHPVDEVRVPHSRRFSVSNVIASFIRSTRNRLWGKRRIDCADFGLPSRAERYRPDLFHFCAKPKTHHTFPRMMKLIRHRALRRIYGATPQLGLSAAGLDTTRRVRPQ